MNGKSMTWYNCKICKKYQSRNNKLPSASKVESEVFALVNTELDLRDDEWVTDAKPLQDGSNVGSADIFIPSRKCIIAVDGSSHFVHKYKVSESKQRRIDDKFNAQALRKFHVIRLHEDDVGSLAECWQAVLDRLEDVIEVTGNTEHHVLHYSDSFYSEDLMSENERDMLENCQYDCK